MKKFFVLYMVPVATIEEMMKNSTPESRKQGMDEWAQWLKARESMFVDMGAPLGKTKRVMKDSTSDAKNDVTGYSIISAESHDEATKLFGGCPHFMLPGAYIDVLEVMEM